ncbi:bifunctional diaminohydroxyphosphoribosylaminopyrimidine deaminase/5-amino-6-(5-phosphoribosylamino)uracil reductase RibD [Algirhabdus cladophorae]|uniref:bifunctional diaminohydroxyphosphoribosylaminopyrimidine deaminase/5-amino-6-(5-phosphoribosylamino)uracil reductase RibD n=1 Tax=Algirhabdus cladophorae TaxID=3377108 RepID=UPI003B846157
MPRSHETYMGLALGLGARGAGLTWPNPSVGCVVVKDDRIIGRGWTQIGGRPHAEVVALAQAGAFARGATVYVTLEPCAHHGKTPPCAEALIAAGVKTVVVAVQDPDPRVDGGGLALLRAAGIDVITNVLAPEALKAHSGFMMRQKLGRPRVSLKLASSFDGRIATGAGESQWITGPQSRRQVHADRAGHDAVMIGGGTARADDPALTVRGWPVARQPVRIVVSRKLDIPLNGKLAKTANQTPLWLCHGSDANPDLSSAWQGLGAKTVACKLAGRQVDMVDALQHLGAAGLTSVYCEGGGALAASLLAADLVDDLMGYIAGLAIGAEGQPALGALGLDRLADAPRFTLVSHRQLGADVLHIWTRETPLI